MWAEMAVNKPLCTWPTAEHLLYSPVNILLGANFECSSSGLKWSKGSCLMVQLAVVRELIGLGCGPKANAQIFQQ